MPAPGQSRHLDLRTDRQRPLDHRCRQRRLPGHRGRRCGRHQRRLAILNQWRHDLDGFWLAHRHQRTAAGGQRQHAGAVCAQCRLQRHGGRRPHLPRWDQTSGVNGGTADASNNGASTPFSTATANASILVDAPPTVVGALVSGTAWTPGFLSILDSAGVGSSAAADQGFELASGANQLITTLPWSNVNQISIAFSEPVNVSAKQPDALQLVQYGHFGHVCRLQRRRQHRHLAVRLDARWPANISSTLRPTRSAI